MKEVKAYIRHVMVNKVIEALEQEGYSDMTLIDCRRITQRLPGEEYKYSLELAQKYMDVIKLEIVCTNTEADKVVRIVQEAAHTGHGGDGRISVSPVETVVQIATGKRDEAILQPEDKKKSPKRAGHGDDR